MIWRCNYVFQIPVGGRCQWPECEGAMPPAHRIERDNATGGIDVLLVCTAHCRQHGPGDTTPLPDRDTIETITGTQGGLFS